LARRGGTGGLASRGARRRPARGPCRGGRRKVAGWRRELERSGGARWLGPAAGEASRRAAGGGLSADCAALAGAWWPLLGPIRRPIFFADVA